MEKVLVQVAIGLHEILVLDGIDELEDPAELLIHSHELYGSLPDIVIEDTGDRWTALEDIHHETAKLIAVVRVRRDLTDIFPGCEYLLPTKTDKGSGVGLRFNGRTILAEGPTYWETYHKLNRKTVH
jgi:hypothetical protein